MTCEKCISYGFYEMVTSGKPFGSSGTIPCFTCSRYTKMKDKFVLAKNDEVRGEYPPVLPQKILKLDSEGYPSDGKREKQGHVRDLKRKQDEIIDVINDMKGVL